MIVKSRECRVNVDILPISPRRGMASQPRAEPKASPWVDEAPKVFALKQLCFSSREKVEFTKIFREVCFASEHCF